MTAEFVSTDPASHVALRDAAAAVVAAVARAASRPGPRSPYSPAALAIAVGQLDPCPEEGLPLETVLEEIEIVLAGGVRVNDPACVAHLHPPPLIAAAATELAIAVTNQSQDAYDGSPAGTLVEDHLVRWLAREHGLGPDGSGVMTLGGTGSNLLGLLLARDRAGEQVRRDGLPPDHRTWRIVASAASHDSIRRSAALLGLGTEAVEAVRTEAHGQISIAALDAALERLRREGLRPIAFVGTAGTTDLGAIDPLDLLADRAAAHRAWFHVDAAVGSGLMLSDTLRQRLYGIERADSVTCDLHKLWWQPFGASALLVPDVERLRAVHHASVYLNRPEDEADGQLNLVGRSLDTSRRFDALKVLVSLRTIGRKRLAEMVDHCVALAVHGAKEVATRPELELLAPPSTVMVVFRALGTDHYELDIDLDALNTRIQRELFASGQVVLGRTRVHGAVALKLTLVNPMTTTEEIDAVLDLVVAAAAPAAAA
jgi:L-2,4-diaminobutyrate decarboxylase